MKNDDDDDEDDEDDQLVHQRCPIFRQTPYVHECVSFLVAVFECIQSLLGSEIAENHVSSQKVGPFDPFLGGFRSSLCLDSRGLVNVPF